MRAWWRRRKPRKPFEEPKETRLEAFQKASAIEKIRVLLRRLPFFLRELMRLRGCMFGKHGKYMILARTTSQEFRNTREQYRWVCRRCGKNLKAIIT